MSVDVTKAIFWQHNEAERLIKLITNKQAAIDKDNAQFWDDFYNDIFNLDTCNDFGLEIWAAILCVSFGPEPQAPIPYAEIFGFDGSEGQNFDNGVFQRVGNIVLDSDQKRLILKLRYLKLISNATIAEINRAVRAVIPDMFFLDGLNMTAIVGTLPYIPDEKLLYVLENFDVIPLPAGVGYEGRYGYTSWFGFDENGGNFDNATFGG